MLHFAVRIATSIILIYFVFCPPCHFFVLSPLSSPTCLHPAAKNLHQLATIASRQSVAPLSSYCLPLSQLLDFGKLLRENLKYLSSPRTPANDPWPAAVIKQRGTELVLTFREWFGTTMNMSGAIATVLVSWLAAHGSAFPSPRQRSQNKFTGGFLPRDQHRQRWTLQGSPFEPADPLVISGNRKYLNQTLSLSENQLDDILSREGGGNILTLDIGVLEERVYWLTARLDLKKNEMKKIAQKHPSILDRQPDENLAPKLEYLQARLLLDDKSLRKIIVAAPNVLGLSTENNIVPKLNWLQKRLDLDDAAVSRMIQKCPKILGVNVDTNLEQTLNWLQRRLNLNDAELSKVIRKMPPLLCCNVDANLGPTLNWLQQRLDLCDATVSKMI